MEITRRRLLELMGAGAAVSALPIALLSRLGGVQNLKAGPARITQLTAKGDVIRWEIPYVEFAEGVTVEYREIRDREEAAGLAGVPTLEVRDGELNPWRQVGIVDSLTIEIPINRQTSSDYGKLELLSDREAS